MKPRIEINFTFSQQLCFLFGKPYVPSESEFLLNNGRSAMLLALRALELPKGAGVGMMIYNCHTVMNVIEQSGCVPVFIDVKDDLTIDVEDLERKASRLSALIVTHLFGMVNDVRTIREMFPNLAIIEDCAHAYGIEKIDGDFATFSIGQGKLPSVGDGGMLLVRNENYQERVACLYNALPGYTKLHSAKLFMKLLVKSWLNSRCIYGWLTLPLKQTRLPVSGKERIVPMRMCRNISAVYAFEKKRMSQRIEKRLQKAEGLKTELETMGVIWTHYGINAFMLIARCHDTERLRRTLKARGLDSATHFNNALVWAEEFGYQQGECPNIEELIHHLLMIPTY